MRAAVTSLWSLGLLLTALSARAQLADVRVNDNSTDGARFTQSETALVVPVVQPSPVCVAWNDFASAIGQTGYGASTAGGSFTDMGSFPASDPNNAATDPSLAFSTDDGLLFFASLGNVGPNGAQQIHLWRTPTCSQPFGYTGKIHTFITHLYLSDREMIAVDNTPSSPCYGRMYVAFLRTFPISIIVGYSDNPVGESDSNGWDASRLVAIPGTVRPQAPWIAIAPNGDLYVAIVETSSTIGGSVSFRVFKSAAGGPTCQAGTSGSWVEKAPLGGGRRPEDEQSSGACGREALGANVRHFPSPQLAIQPASGSPGYVIHAVYGYDDDGAPDGVPPGLDEANVFYRRSMDGADSWSAQVQLGSDDPTDADQWQPAIAVAANGVVAATWYDRRLDWPANLRFFRAATLSMDGGTTWERTAQLSDVVSDVTPTGPPPQFPIADPPAGNCYHSDYDQIAVDPNGYFFHAVWSDDRALLPAALLDPNASCEPFQSSQGSCPNPDIYYQRIEDLSPADGVYEPWDICNAYANPRVASPQPWMTLMSRQRDGDADGFGNACDPTTRTA